MKKALKKMWEMQAFLAERGIDAHVNTTTAESEFGEIHSCDIHVFGPEKGEIISVSWANYRADEFDNAWTQFERQVADKFFGWWEE